VPMGLFRAMLPIVCLKSSAKRISAMAYDPITRDNYRE
jgi:hypothetical protein